jgi:hypothetical protein
MFFDGAQESSPKRLQIPFDEIEFIFTRGSSLESPGIEVFTKKSQSYYFNIWSSFGAFWEWLVKAKPPIETDKPPKFDFFYSLRSLCGSICQTKAASKLLSGLKLTELWQKWQITNYEYLYFLNVLSGRSFNVLDRYPVFPWLFKVCDAEVIDLNDESISRDLATPIAALSPSRREHTDKNWERTNGTQEHSQSRVGYSSCAVVMNFLLRVEPFTTQHIKFQSGKFDHAARLWWFVPLMVSLMYGSAEEQREAIPELFTFPYLFRNHNELDLGENVRTGQRVDHVLLPKWARDEYHFVAAQMAALEGSYVSMHLADWIDIIFGVFRCDKDHYTVLMPYFYPEFHSEDSVIMEHAKLWNGRFGSVPCQLFIEKHPSRLERPVAICPHPVRVDHDVVRIRKQVIVTESSIIDCRNSPVAMMLPCIGDVWAVSRVLGLVIFGTGSDLFASVFDMQTKETAYASHDTSLVTCATVIGGRVLVTGGSDGSLRFWGLPNVGLISVSSLHCESVTAVAGCYESGLIVSTDRANNLVFQTMVHHAFIRCTKLQSVAAAKPMIAVFKSRLVVVVSQAGNQATEVRLFDAKGDLIRDVEVVPGIVSECDKYCGVDSREFVLLGCDSGVVLVYDVATFDLLTRIRAGKGKPRFCAVKKAGRVMLANKSGVTVVAFDAALSTVVQAVTRIVN